MAEAEPIIAVILAGGRGTRMHNTRVHKVCHTVRGVPFILHALQAYSNAGIRHSIIVVGELGDQVISVAGRRFPDVTFAYQPTPVGTGNAARCGVRVLEDSGYSGSVLVVMGDRLLSVHAIHKLTEAFKQSGADAAMLVGHKRDNPSSGRVLLDEQGNTQAIVEVSDIALAELVHEAELVLQNGHGTNGSIPSVVLLDTIRRYFPSEHKASIACGSLYQELNDKPAVKVAVVRESLEAMRRRTTYELRRGDVLAQVSAAQAEEATDAANLACYLFRAPVLYEGLRSLNRDNAQGEEYLTAAVMHIASQQDAQGSPKYRVLSVSIDSPSDALTFNTPEDLARLERDMRPLDASALDLVEHPQLLHELTYRTVADWHMLFSTNPASVQGFMEHVYGPDRTLHEARRSAILQALTYYSTRYNMHDKVFIVRSPGRLNLMGRHIDHRGGRTNVVAISEEIVFICSPREDDVIELSNTDEEQFEPASFSIAEQIGDLEWSDWVSCINSPQTLQMVQNGAWENYAKAAALKLQDRYRETPLKGARIVAHGTIPIGAGLSSSSAVVVGVAEALVAINRLPVHANLMVDICGEGEWFVGTRGGANDHAAITFGRRHQVAHLSFSPFAVLGFHPFPPDHSVIVCNSGVQAKKSAGARSTFNSKIMGYVVGEVLFKRFYPEYANRIQHLRDVDCDALGLELAQLYRMLKAIPLRLSYQDLREQYGPLTPPNFSEEDLRKLDHVFATLTDETVEFDVRGVMLFGLAEQERAKRCVQLLSQDATERFGELWYASHDGDRVVSHDADLNPQPWKYEVDDEYLDGLIAHLQSGDSKRVAMAQRHMQPGKYACSTAKIDRIVDICRMIPGVRGAQMAGAGLGGCVMILALDSACSEVVATLKGHGFEAYQYRLAEGAGLVVI